MANSPRSRTFRPSDTAGAPRRLSLPDGQLPQDRRAAADETAHAFKGSLATIRSSIEPLRRAVPTENARARRALELIEAAVDRLVALVEAVHERDCAAAVADEPSADTTRN